MIILSIILILTVYSVMPTFSWYNRSGEKSGAEYSYSGEYPAAGYSETSIVTYKGNVDEDVDKHNVIYDTTKLTGEITGTVESGGIAYYKSVISNSGDTAAKVNLFFDSLTTGSNSLSDKLYVGTTFPAYNKQAYSPKYSFTKRQNNTIRVYFQPKTYWTSGSYHLYYYDAITSRSHVTMTKCPKVTDYQAYYADIPATAHGFFIANQNNQHAGGGNRIESVLLNNSDDSKDITQLSSTVIYLESGTSGDYSNQNFNMAKTDGANVSQYYDRIYGDVGATYKLALVKGTDYKGSSITYTDDSSNDVVTINNGVLTFNKAGTETITTKITGVYGDTITLKTEVEVNDPRSQVPVIENISIDAGGNIEVCWFIKNESDSALNYTIGGVSTSL